MLKFFLNVSREEQRKRFMDRLTLAEKNWKFQASDVVERAYWDRYMKAYEQAIRATATEAAPWYVVPADNKWFTRLVVAAAIVDRLVLADVEHGRTYNVVEVNQKLKSRFATSPAMRYPLIRKKMSTP